MYSSAAMATRFVLTPNNLMRLAAIVSDRYEKKEVKAPLSSCLIIHHLLTCRVHIHLDLTRWPIPTCPSERQ